MKKLLGLLAATTFLTTGTISVAACTTNNKKPNDNNEANDIKNKITDPNLALDSSVLPTTSDPKTIAAMKALLKQLNPGLQNVDMSVFSFATKVALKNDGSEEATPVLATIKVEDQTAQITLFVSIHATPAQITKKITSIKFNFQAEQTAATDPTIKAKALKQGLKTANFKLTQYDLTQISFDDLSKLNFNVLAGTSINFKIASQKQSVNKLEVVMLNASGKVAEKISNKDLLLASNTNKSTSNPETIKALIAALKVANPALSFQADSIFSFNSTNLINDGSEKTLPVTCDIKIGTETKASVPLQVAIQATAAQIAAKDIRTNISISSDEANLTQVNADKVQNIFNSLNTDTLTAWDLTQISIPVSKSTPTPLTQDTPVTIKADIKNGTSAPVQFNLEVTRRSVADADQATADNIANKIDPNLLVAIKAGSNVAISNADTIKAIKTSLQEANPALLEDDLAKISFAIPEGNLADDETDNLVTTTVTVNSKTTTITLTKVQIHATAAQIQAKLDNVARLAVSFINAKSSDDKLDQTNIDLILPIIKANNPQLSSYDLNQLSIDVDASKTLTADTREDVTLKIKDDQTPSTSADTIIKVARFTADTAKYQAFKIADKIGTALIVGIPTGANVSVTNPATVTALRASLVTANSDVKLTAQEAAKITFTGSNLNAAEANNPVSAVITESAGNTDTVDLTKVQIHRSTADIKALITNPTTTEISIPAGSDKSLANATTQAVLKKAIQTQYSLSDYDISTITFPDASSTTLKGDEQINTVKLSITDDATPKATDTVDLTQVKIHRTRVEIQSLIKNGIPRGEVDITGAGGKTGDGDIDARIKTALQTAVSQLSNWDLSQISIKAGVTIDNTKYTPVEITIVDDSRVITPITETINVKSAS